MSIQVRPFDATDSDYVTVTYIENSVWTDFQVTVNERKYQDQNRDPNYLYQRVVIELDGRAIGTGFYHEPSTAYKPGKYFFSVTVLPKYRRQGAGSAFYAYLRRDLDGREPTPTLLASHTLESHAAAIRFLQKRGFKQVMRSPICVLDVTRFDPAQYADHVAQVEAGGVKLLSLRELQKTDPDWKRKLWELGELKIMPDVPSPDPYTPQSLEQFEKRFLDAPFFDSQAVFIAVDGDEYVGLSALMRPEATPEQWFTGLTGVLHDHRRRGIARALKVKAIAYAKRQGVKKIDTDNEENNPMYDLNRQLGFEPRPAWLDFEKQL